ncbi:MAG TPA: 3D domain-containing protein [Solirubrobacteraceae bacterium]|nr:3D domain-containing protein [Solirubrobacteraceae bacterium]
MRLLRWSVLGFGVMVALPVVAVITAISFIAGTAGQCTASPAGSGAATGHGGFEETAYGPPWNQLNGSGVTAYGMDLTAGQPMLEIAIDPSVLQPLAFYHVWPNPFGTHGAFIAGDTGGAIKGAHIDTYDWLGRASQDAWGTRYGVTVTSAANPGAGSATGEIEAPPTTPTEAQGVCSELLETSLPPGVYTNPFHTSTSIYPARIDMGVDYTGTGPIVALGDGTVTYSQSSDAGWGPFSCSGGHGGAIVYRLADGPDSGRYVYLAEGIIPTVTDGQQLRAGEQVATFTGCIETGWGSGSGDQPMAQVTVPEQACTSGDPGCHSTWCGNNMSQLIHALGAPAGIPQGPTYGEGC